MLRWTQAGAVPAPRTVQIRVQQAIVGRIAAGAPVPPRGLDPRELIENIRYFTHGLRGPRSRPCETLVLTGAGLSTRPDLGAAVVIARAEGVERVVMHVDLDDLEAVAGGEHGGLADALVVRIEPGDGLRRALAAVEAAVRRGQEVRAALVLGGGPAAPWVEAARSVVEAGARAVQLSYPFPGAELARPPVPEAAALADAVAAAVPASVGFSVKGLPACVLMESTAERGSWRTPNRWYVDARHQKQAAVLFLPDVVRFAKADLCRFCALDGRCDGFFAGEGLSPGLPPLSPRT